MNTLNAFNEFIQTILDSGLAPDKAADVIGNFLEYRSLVKSEVSSAQDFAIRLREDLKDLRSLNDELICKIAKLEKELAEAKPATELTISMNLDRLMDKCDDMQKVYINFVKWVRHEGIVMGDGNKVGLYEAKYVADYLMAYFGFKEMGNYPSRGEEYETVVWETDREELVQNIEWLLTFNYPGWKIVWI